MFRFIKNFMKNFLLIAIALLSFHACQSKKSMVDLDTLPKDISLKPDNIILQQEQKQAMSDLIKDIDSLIQTESCDDASNWEFTAIGAKPCGGPSSYIAYPKKLAGEILPKVADLTAKQMAFNKKYGMMSDCAFISEPTGIKCEDGKAVLVRDSEVTIAE